MTIRIGDKVRFLNEVGGGIVCGFKNKEIVLVEDQDGFEIPVLIRECVVIESSSGPAMTTTSEEMVSTPASGRVTTLANKKEFQAYIAISPEFPDAPLQGKLEMYLVNDSNYFFYYLCEETDKDGNSIADGLLHPNTHQPIGTFTAQNLGELGKMRVRLLPFMRGKDYNSLATKEKVVSFNAVKLSKTGSYEETEYLSFSAHLIPLHKDVVEDAIKDLKQEGIGKKHQSPKSQLKSPKKTNELIEVDLHIEALIDDFTGMSKGEMLEFQISKFDSTILENKGKKGQRIVFIHGVGNGRLKTDIRKALERKYKLDYQDASFREYGYGATMVIVR